MTTTDWIIDITLILIVVRQMREAPINWHFVLIPAGIVAFTAHNYLHGLPTGGSALVLVVAAVALGAVLGVIGGLITKVRAVDGQARAQAGVTAAALWIASMSARLGFIIWITHPAGETAIAHFSAAHGITSGTAWQTALVLLALTEVATRIAIIVIRGYLAVGAEQNRTAAQRPHALAA